MVSAEKRSNALIYCLNEFDTKLPVESACDFVSALRVAVTLDAFPNESDRAIEFGRHVIGTVAHFGIFDDLPKAKAVLNELEESVSSKEGAMHLFNVISAWTENPRDESLKDDRTFDLLSSLYNKKKLRTLDIVVPVEPDRIFHDPVIFR